jgi:ribonuclease HII
MPPDFTRETAARMRGQTVAGIDEAGRGPLAGPVVAAAVVLDPDRIPAGLDDSKVLPARTRERLHADLLSVSKVSVGIASVEEIDGINILRASHLAMMRALAGLVSAPDLVLIDGNQIPDGCPVPARAVVGGDAACLSIAAASLVAKVTRDRIMVVLAQQYPGYGWERNKGYGSREHLAALASLGPTPLHRRSFAPVHKLLYQAVSLSP